MKIITVPQGMDVIYSMGFDVWGDGQSLQNYLMNCRQSSKYQSGTWQMLCINDEPVSSLIVYSNQFGLSKNCYGIGSVATEPANLRTGDEAYLISEITQRLLNQQKANPIYLHSDIDTDFYRKLGFENVGVSGCMILRGKYFNGNFFRPSYF